MTIKCFCDICDKETDFGRFEVNHKGVERERPLVRGTPLLLGQSFLARFKSWSLDNTRCVLVPNP